MSGILFGNGGWSRWRDAQLRGSAPYMGKLTAGRGCKGIAVIENAVNFCYIFTVGKLA
jgi:hypothetical protein